MDPFETDTDPVASLHAAVNSYLSTLLAVAECLGSACPPVGGPYRHRLSRMEKRLAVDASPEYIEETCAKVAQELEDYAAKAAAYLRCHEVELRKAAAGVEEIVGALAQRQEFYAAQLLQLAGAAGLPAADVKACVENMGHESQSLLAQMRGKLAAVEQRLSEFEITDPVTGLTNRREMERRIRAASAGGPAPVLIRFDLGGPVPDDAARQVGARVASQFRYNDLVCRWSEREFLVLFQGPLDVAQVRSAQVAPWVAGRYLLDNGEIADIRIAHVQVATGLDRFDALPATPTEPAAAPA
ncbi:MAG TPA: hypothetical protein VN841_27785 [Bryobacteraceae bacterium]|nr:hypothetical protein [Bryobacteraceae bacterium]